jgi:EAL domain-containing protein (putative c-di-GMP-specific phosphodiesterase class I)
MVAAALVASGLAPDRLMLEITEGVLLSDATTTIERLVALRRLGVKIAIDDFGTGYSSLSYLRRLPLDAVKIDRSFIEQLAQDPRQAALVRAIVELGRALGLTTIAEGVETAAQARRLVDLGCELAQGYFFGRPMPAADVARAMARYTGVRRLTSASGDPDDGLPQPSRTIATGVGHRNRPSLARTRGRSAGVSAP